jgi:hypothetical protein
MEANRSVFENNAGGLRIKGGASNPVVGLFEAHPDATAGKRG